MKKNILICGHFANNKVSFDGQTIKTVNIYNELAKKFGKERIIISDTYFIKKNPLLFFLHILKHLKYVNNIIILPAQRGIRFIVPFFNFLNRKRKFNIHYVVIGAWLPSLINNKSFLIKELKKIDFIYLETSNTINEMKKMGFKNTLQMNNFKRLKVSKYKYKKSSNLRFCIFSRIEYLKGINDAIDVFQYINNNANYKIYLDLYGKIKKEYENEFYEKIKFDKYIKYKGVVNSDESVNVIEKYDFLLFPTLFYTEGIPGTIIDSYFAGTPVLCSRWENYRDVVKENCTGITFKFGDKIDLQSKIINIIENEYDVLKMRENCKKEAIKYFPDNSLNVLLNNLK